MVKKKVLFITPSLCQGGLEHSLITMLTLLDENKYDMYLYTYGDDLSLLPLVPRYVHFKNDLLNKHYQRNAKAISLWTGETFFSKVGKKERAERYTEKRKDFIHKQKVNQINKAYRNCNFDVVVGNSIGMTSEMAAVVNAKKRFVVYHSSLDIHHDLMAELFSSFDKIVAVNDGVKDMLNNNYDNLSEKIVVIYNYVDANIILEKANESVDFTLTTSKTILVTCGRISKEKGFDLAVDAAESLKKRGVSFHWFFVGDGADREKIESRITEKSLDNKITITGYKDNPFPYISSSDIYVQPSYEEAQPLVLLETMVLGKPIVSTNTVGGKLILENGKKGVLTDFSGEALADGISTLIQNPEKRESFSNVYCVNENVKEREIYLKKWDELLS